MRVVAVIPAAGFSSRMKGKPKLYLKFNGMPVLALTLGNISRCKEIDSIILVVNEADVKRAKALVKRYALKKVKDIVIGGKTRQESVARGISRLNGGAEFVLVHDGARPFVDREIISRALLAAGKYGAAIAGVPAKSTIKRVGKDKFVSCTLNREELWEIQTPQVFKKDTILKAMAGGAATVTDDSALVERLGKKVKVVMGSYRNIKITTPEDIVFAKALMSGRN